MAEAVFRQGAQFIAAWRIGNSSTLLRSMGPHYAELLEGHRRSMVRRPGDPARAKPADRTSCSMPSSSSRLPRCRCRAQALKDKKIKLGFLSNFTRKMLDAGIRTPGSTACSIRVLSTDAIKTYKPDPRRTRWRSTPSAQREEIGFVAHLPHGAAGAKWLAYPRSGSIAQTGTGRLEFTPDTTVTSLTELVPS